MTSILKDEISGNEKVNENDKAQVNAYSPISVNPSSLNFSAAGGTNVVSVTCADSSWKYSSGNAWVNVSRVSSSQLRITVSSNTGHTRGYGIACTSGSYNATIVIRQNAGSSVVSYDLSNSYSHVVQGKNNCALACAAMCVHDTLANVIVANDQKEVVINWSLVAGVYGYTVRTELYASYQDIISYLKKGEAVIIKVAGTPDISDEKTDHWVTIVKFTGVEASATAANFYCYDPYKEDTLFCLTNTTRFDPALTTHSIRIFEKN